MKQIIRKLNLKRQPVDVKNIRKLLFVKLFAIGDCLNATPALRALRKGIPGIDIDVLVGTWSAAVFRNNPNANNLIEVDDVWFRKRDPVALVKLIMQLSRSRYDSALLFHRESKLGALLAFAGIPVRIGLDLEGDGYWLTHPVVEDKIEHEINIYNSLLKPLDVPDDGTVMDYITTEENRSEAENIWIDSNIDPERVVIGMTPGGAKNPGETMPQRVWRRYGELTELLIARNYQVVLFGGPGDKGSLTQFPRHDRVVSFIGKSSLGTTAELMKRCQLIVTHDSGPMHLAAATGTKTLSLFAPTDPRRKAPPGAEHRHITADLQCAPCYHRGHWQQSCSQECIDSISAVQVTEEIENMLIL